MPVVGDAGSSVGKQVMACAGNHLLDSQCTDAQSLLLNISSMTFGEMHTSSQLLKEMQHI